jgi:hypothetical protein
MSYLRTFFVPIGALAQTISWQEPWGIGIEIMELIKVSEMWAMQLLGNERLLL